MTPEQAARLRKHVIVALDFAQMEDALALVDQLFPRVDKFKVGSRLFTRYGPAILDALAERGAAVFLDLKFHDIPSVVGAACAQAALHPAVFLLTVHASGGARMVAQARASVAHRDDVRVIAVTALTSWASGELHTVGVELNLEDWALKLAELAVEAGADGVVCSPREVALLSARLPEGTTFVTPGIRFGGEDDDQTRTLDAAQALDQGASYLVIGRPIYAAADPSAALDAIGATL